MSAPWKSTLGGLLAALLFLAVWLPLHPAAPPLETADLYEHLSVARHLVQGEGFRTDLAYPLSFAFPFARELPQPLIHRGPAFALLLTAPYTLAGGDPAATVAAVRWLQVGILAVLAALGSVALFRRGQVADVLPWLLLLGGNPLLPFAVDWGFEELLAGLLAFGIWLRVREEQAPGWFDGLLGGLLVMLRPELIWLPLLWWFWFAVEKKRLIGLAGKTAPALPWRRLFLAVGLFLLLQAPWAVRNLRLTGNPVFSLQAQAELVKDTRTWPGYSVYKQLEPQPVDKVLAGDPVPVLRKTARGLKFYLRETSKLLPVPYLVVGMLLVFGLVRGRVTDNPCPFRRDSRPLGILATDHPLGPLGAAMVSLLLLALEYSFFDHSLRHLLPLVPVLAWECAPLLGSLGLGALTRSKQPPRGEGQSWLGRPPITLLVAALLTTGLLAASHRQTPGWELARHQARRQAESLPARTAAFSALSADRLFVDSSAVPWYADRPAVWTPDDPEVSHRIRGLLADHR